MQSENKRHYLMDRKTGTVVNIVNVTFETAAKLNDLTVTKRAGHEYVWDKDLAVWRHENGFLF